jgi:hypothetical protein
MILLLVVVLLGLFALVLISSIREHKKSKNPDKKKINLLDNSNWE